MPFRTIDTDIWSNAWFYDLTPAQKVMFIYLFSNPLVSNIGVLEVSRKQLAATTGVSVAAANKFLDELEQDGQIVVDGRLILIVDFISKQTHFGGNTEANKNDKLLKNLQALFSACPSKKLQRVLEGTYPNLFKDIATPSKTVASEQQAPCLSETSPLQAANKTLVSEQEGSGGDIGEYGDIGDISSLPHTPSATSQPAACASGVCVPGETLLPEPPAYLDEVPDEDPAMPVEATMPAPETAGDDWGQVPESRGTTGDNYRRQPGTTAGDTGDNCQGQPGTAPEKPKRRKDKKAAEPLLRPDDWAQWYARYPKHQGKEPGKTAWNKAVEAGVLPDLPTLLAALEWQVPVNGWSPDRMQYIPLPATYLNNQRWQDEKPAMPTRPPRPPYGPQLPSSYGSAYGQPFSKADEMSYVVEKNRIVGAQVLAEMAAEDRAREAQNAANQY